MQFTRVKQAETGHELSVPDEHLAAADKGAYTVLDKPAVDDGGDPLPPKYMTTVDAEAAKKAVPYDKRKKADLEDLVAKRNEGRDDADLIEVGGNGTIADLAEALEADDNDPAFNQDGHEADDNEGNS